MDDTRKRTAEQAELDDENVSSGPVTKRATSCLAEWRPSSQRPRYRYDPLPHQDSIRLIKICAVYPELSCEIKTVRLSDTPSYEALSYCWGSPGQQVPVTCNTASFYVSPGLSKGLIQLYRYRQTGWFWIDQMCIHQEDGTERTHQVRLMKSIYQQAIRTVIWLPIDDGAAVAAKSLINELYHLSEMDEERIKPEQDDMVENMAKKEDHTQPHLLIPTQDDARWRAFDMFLKLPWFTRVWIIQEVALSRNSPTMLCGAQSIGWERLVDAVEWLYEMYHKVGLWVNIGYIHDILIICRKRVWVDGTNDVTWDLQGLLRLTVRFHATEPRDRIFALLGLCRETRDAAHWPPELNPDYKKPLMDLFIEIARYLVREKKSTDILRLASGVRQKEGYPSWVPRWDNSLNDPSLYGGPEVFMASHWTDVKDPFNDVSYGRVPVIDETTHAAILRLRGIRIGSVISYCKVIRREDIWDDSGVTSIIRNDFQPKLRMMLDACKEALPHLSAEDIHRAFFMVTCLGLTSNWKDALSEPLIHFESYMGLQPTTSQDSVQSDAGCSLFPSHRRPSVNPEPSRYFSRLAGMINNRVFVTSSGQLGLGPAHMKPNDEVVVLFGGELPFLLRPLVNGQWKFVGPCYVHGIMKGEALAGEGANENNHEWFELV
jgi:hypothetical protein